jgi:hypothetical protein
MVDEQLAQAIFVECTRRVAFERYASKARGKDLNFVLEFTDSQLARDGLASAAGIFAGAIAPHLVHKDKILSLAMTYAEKAPIENWWRPKFHSCIPRTRLTTRLCWR